MRPAPVGQSPPPSSPCSPVRARPPRRCSPMPRRGSPFPTDSRSSASPVRRSSTGRSSPISTSGPAVCRRFLGLERQGGKAARRSAASHRAPRGHGRRRPVRPQRGLRRQDDVPRRRDVARRLALRRGAAEHLETDRHRRRRRCRPARGMVPGQNAHRLRQRSARPVSGPDGWIYWCKGAFAQQTYERAGKPPLVTRAAHIFRRRPGDPAIDAGHDRRDGQPGRRGIHGHGRTHLHRHVPRSPAGRPARRARPRDLWRRVRQASRGDRRASSAPAI